MLPPIDTQIWRRMGLQFMIFGSLFVLLSLGIITAYLAGEPIHLPWHVGTSLAGKPIRVPGPVATSLFQIIQLVVPIGLGGSIFLLVGFGLRRISPK